MITEIIGKAVVIDVNYKVTMVLFLALVVLIGAPMVSAKSSYLSSFDQHYNTSGTRLDTCNTCHTSSGGGSLNPYGSAFSGSGHNFASIEVLDSDNDGFTNVEEINARTFPGNPSDHPLATSQTPTATTPNVTQQQVTATTVISVASDDEDDAEEEQEATELSEDDVKEQQITPIPVSNVSQEKPSVQVPVNNTTEEKPATEVPTNNTTETPKSPGFEAIFAVAGFLIIVGLNRK
ncbi:hypothetical protein [uncultured Methanomethylovorans sp.]|uniref:hypothetical protein n=1 Tax=uncultured Methanomethylovorans sp. TaxID=183759 RepID=UPI002AA6A8E6|nr:hypothetical protein [uncultured Methanomethylovorans sp.]